MTHSAIQRIIVTAPARLHMGFLDLNGGLGRNFGSLGLTISGLATTVSVDPAELLSVQGPEAPRAEKIARLLLARHEESHGARIVITEAIPAHVGLGSGTQLALAVGVALAKLFRWDMNTRAIAHFAGRGSRSGIGIGAFDIGGFLVDGGRGDRVEPPRIVARMPFPAAWRILLVFDKQGHGIHGEKETSAFADLPEFPAATAAELCRLTLMQVLPALQDEDIVSFGRAIGAVQKIVGDYFAPAQGGRFTSPAVTDALHWFEDQGVAGVGQSSWGPTGFALLASETQAHSLLRTAQARQGNNNQLSFAIVNGLNRGGAIQIQTLDNRQRVSNLK